jgi:hypothetical protein
VARHARVGLAFIAGDWGNKRRAYSNTPHKHQAKGKERETKQLGKNGDKRKLLWQNKFAEIS